MAGPIQMNANVKRTEVGHNTKLCFGNRNAHIERTMLVVQYKCHCDKVDSKQIIALVKVDDHQYETWKKAQGKKIVEKQ